LDNGVDPLREWLYPDDWLYFDMRDRRRHYGLFRGHVLPRRRGVLQMRMKHPMVATLRRRRFGAGLNPKEKDLCKDPAQNPLP
jgi:hypothetical protein